MTRVDVRTQWRGHRDTERWRLGVLLALSGALHLVFTPWAALWGLVRWLPDWRVNPVPEEAVNAIPVDLIADEPEPPAPDPAPETEAAGEPLEAEPDVEDAAAPAPAPPEPVAPRPEPPPAPPAPTPADGQIGDPVTLSGSAGKIADPNANVRILLYTDQIRSHPLGLRIGRLLRRTPQWRDFFGPAQVDPIRDIDRVLIAGPQLRDSSNVVAVVQHRLPDERMEKGLDALIARGGGTWLPGEGKVARTVADRAERIIALPAPGIVAVVPPSAEESARGLGKDTSFGEAPEGVAMQAYAVTPWRVFLGTPVQIPRSIEWVRLEVRPRPDGGASLRLVARDASEADARRSAREIELLLRAAGSGELLAGVPKVVARRLMRGLEGMLAKVQLRAEGRQIVGELDATAREVEATLDMVEFAADVAAAMAGVFGDAAPPPQPLEAAPGPRGERGSAEGEPSPTRTAEGTAAEEARSARTEEASPEEPRSPSGSSRSEGSSPSEGAPEKAPEPSTPPEPSPRESAGPPPGDGASRPPGSDPASSPRSDAPVADER